MFLIEIVILLIHRKLIFNYELFINLFHAEFDEFYNRITSIKSALGLALSQFLLQINPVSVCCFCPVTSAGTAA